LRYFVEELNVCEQKVDTVLQFSINDSEIRSKNERNNMEIHIEGDFSKYLEVLEARRINSVNDVRKSMAFVIEQVEEDLGNEIENKKFENVKLETDGFSVYADNNGISAKYDNIKILVLHHKENEANGIASPEVYLMAVLSVILSMASPEEIK